MLACDALSEPRLKVLADVSRALAEVVTNHDVLMETIARVVTEHVVETAILFLISDDERWLELVTIHSQDARMEQMVRQLHREQRVAVGPGSTIGQTAATGEPMFLPITTIEQMKRIALPESYHIVEAVGVSALLNMPLKARGRVIGVLTMLRHGAPGRHMSDDDRQLAQDLGDRAALAIDNARLYRSLEQRVAERTAELAEVNKELESFSYSVSHDLRAPLRAIDGFSKILLEDHIAGLDPEAVRVINVIRKNTERMGRLIEDLLAFSRLGRQAIHVEAVGMTTLARRIGSELIEAEAGRTPELRVGDLPPCRCDRQLIAQVWSNLIGNAVKYTRGHDPATIQIEGEVTDSELVYRVVDNGIGFEMAYVDKLFGVFQRLCTDAQYEGTGVGLALVQRIVQRHGGRVFATGELGRGATIGFALPLQEQP